MVKMEVTTLMVPHQVQRTGVRRGLLEDLALKLLYLHGEMSLMELAERTCLSLGVIEEIFQFFRKEQLVEVKRMAAGSHVIVASAQGKQRSAELLTMNQYTGPAPVSLADYTHARGHAERAEDRAQTGGHQPGVLPTCARSGHADATRNCAWSLGLRCSCTGLRARARPASRLRFPPFTMIMFGYRTRSSSTIKSFRCSILACTFQARPKFPRSPTGGGCCAAGRACSRAASFPRKCWTFSSIRSAGSTLRRCK